MLWPFFIKDEKDLNTDNPRSSLWVVPFYMQTTSPRSSFYAVMWPFFTYMRVQDRTEIKAPWPFFSHTTGKEENGFQHLAPLFAQPNGQGRGHLRALARLQRDRAVSGRQEVDPEEGTPHRQVRDGRPGTFFNSGRFLITAGEAETVFYFPSILPWRNPEFDRIVRPLMTLYEYRKDGRQNDDEPPLRLLHEGAGGERWKRRLAFLLEVEEGARRHGFSGLFRPLRPGQQKDENLLYAHKAR